MTSLEEAVRCLHQVLPSESATAPPSGWGDCTRCEYDPEKNLGCKGYSPITLYAFEVNE